LAGESATDDFAERFVRRRQIQVRGKQLARLRERAIDELRDVEDVDARIRLRKLRECERRIGRAEVDADGVPQRHSCLTENSSFHARPACDTSCSSSVPTSVTWERR